METLTRLVTESLPLHGFDRPRNYGRLEWSQWFRCESHHSLLVIPNKPGVFAPAEEVIDLESSKAQVEPAASAATGTGSHLATPLELRPEPPSVNWTPAPVSGNSTRTQASGNDRRTTTRPRLNSAIATTIHCSSSYPSGF